jgi:hypothetical protein
MPDDWVGGKQMIDGFMVLTPVLVLLLTLYFIFTGCSDNDNPLTLRLDYDPGFKKDVKQIKVSFLCHEEGTWGEFTDATIYKNDSISDEGGHIEQPCSIFLASKGRVYCFCKVTTSPMPSDETVEGTEHNPLEATQFKDKDENVLPFHLSRSGNGFSVTY